MFAKKVCQKSLSESLTFMHKRRQEAVFDSVWSLVNQGELSLTGIARDMRRESKVRHRIKCVDRLLSNKTLQAESVEVYRAICHALISKLDTLYILVDWSGCCRETYHVLRASLAFKGRSITVYNEVHPQALLGSSKAHVAFLEQLSQLIPKDKKVVIITDGGFRTPWFHKVVSLGWDFIGRIRDNKQQILLEEGSLWTAIRAFNPKATRQVRYLGKGFLGKTLRQHVNVNLYCYKEPSKGRKEQSRYPDVNKRYRGYHAEPWMLVTSLSGGQEKAAEIKNLYKKRMQIEQNFRDDKNARFGFSWRYSRTSSPERITVLLLLATLASFFLWWIGFMAESLGWHRDFQANSIKHRRVLSFIFLGKQVIRHWHNKLRLSQLEEAIQLFNKQYQELAYA